MPTVAGVIDQFLHPPIGGLKNELDVGGPYGPGSHTLATWSQGGPALPVSATFGVIAIINGSIPLGMGYQLGWDGGGGPVFDGNRYIDRVCQIVVQYQLLLGFGGYVNAQICNQYYLAQMWLWDQALPGRIGLYVAPHLAIDLQYLVAV